MRHQNSGRQLSRNSSHRKSLLQNLSKALIQYEMIQTTLAKAKELRRYFEPLVTRAKKDTLANRRYLFARLRNEALVDKLITQFGQQYQSRPGGYLRVLKNGFRAGDAAPLAVVMFVSENAE